MPEISPRPRARGKRLHGGALFALADPLRARGRGGSDGRKRRPTRPGGRESDEVWDYDMMNKLSNGAGSASGTDRDGEWR